MINLVLVGVSHKTAPLEIRERLAFSPEVVPDALKNLRKQFGFSEGLIVSTCNRVEVLAHTPKKTDEGSTKLKSFLEHFHSFPLSKLENHLYAHHDRDAIRHLFRVAASLDSMVVGEPQILSQLKQAYRLASDAGSVGSQFNTLLPRAFFVAKRIRTETRIAHAAVSVSSVAVELAQKIFGDLARKTVLLLGAGEMGKLATRNLARSGASKVLIVNRSLSKGEELARSYQGTAVPFEDLHQSLVEADIVVVSTGARDFLLGPEQVAPVVRQRKYRPIFIIDISVPRNVDPRVNEIENAFLFDIDDLQAVVESNLGERMREAELAEEIIREEVHNYLRMVASNHTGPLIGRLRQRVEEICLHELESKQGGMDPEQYEQTAQMLRRAAHKLAHPLIMQIKSAQPDPEQRFQTIEIIRRAFRLDEDS